MTNEERVQAIADYGFTDRQARFLVLVMRHSGLCIKRQYGTLAGVPRGGEKCNVFFEKLVRRGFATTSPCLHNRARLFHLHSKPLYHAIGEPDSRYRRAVPARQVRHRLMRLDAALLGPDLDWLTTRTEKLAWLATHRPVEGSVSPADSLPDHSDLLPGTFPMGTDATGRLVILYIVTVPWTEDFRLFLKGHEPVLAAAPTWTLRVVLPASLRRVADDYTTAVHEELESPVADPGEVGWFFFHRRRGTDWREYIKPGGEALKSKAVRCLTTYTGPRFTLLYRRWLAEGEAALKPISPRIREALAAGRAGLECVVLPYDYEPFSPLVSRRRGSRPLHTVEDDGGEHEGEAVSRSPFLTRVLNRGRIVSSIIRHGFRRSGARDSNVLQAHRYRRQRSMRRRGGVFCRPAGRLLYLHTQTPRRERPRTWPRLRFAGHIRVVHAVVSAARFCAPEWAMNASSNRCESVRDARRFHFPFSPSRPTGWRGARRGQRLGAAHRPPGIRWAASGIDRACAPRKVWLLRDGREWLTLTPHFDRAYPADISLVSSRHPLRIARCGARANRRPQDPGQHVTLDKQTAGVRPQVPTPRRVSWRGFSDPRSSHTRLKPESLPPSADRD